MKKNKSSRHIVYMLAVCALVAAAAVLTLPGGEARGGCRRGGKKKIV